MNLKIKWLNNHLKLDDTNEGSKWNGAFIRFSRNDHQQRNMKDEGKNHNLCVSGLLCFSAIKIGIVKGVNLSGFAPFTIHHITVISHSIHKCLLNCLLEVVLPIWEISCNRFKYYQVSMIQALGYFPMENHQTNTLRYWRWYYSFRPPMIIGDGTAFPSAGRR